MIRRTFQILPSIGVGRERGIWESGIGDWGDFLVADKVPGVSRARKVDLDAMLKEAERHLDDGMTDYFTGILPRREHWRLYDRFSDSAAFLDIETDGLGPGAEVTVVSVRVGGETTTLVKGIDLDARSLDSAFDGASMLVTFNGSTFDVPMLSREFPFSIPRVPHFDLRHACARIGWTGGLKSIERMLGMVRDREVEYVTGSDAVHLWHLWRRKGSENALRTLMRYNVLDTDNLEPLAGIVYDRLRGGCE